MRKPIKHKVGIWLLVSLMPALIILIAAVELSDDTGNTPFAVGAMGLLSFSYFLVALITSPALIIWGSVQAKRTYRVAQRYAELNGWHPISRTSWRNRKRNQVALSVTQAYEKSTYILTVDANGETTTIDEFETPIWALQFGDWLWEQLLEDNTAPDKVQVAEKRAEWETTALAIIPPGRTQTVQRAPEQTRPTTPIAQMERQRAPQPPPEETGQIPSCLHVSPPNPHAPPPSLDKPLPRKDKATAAILAILLGWLGAHKFYLGHIGLGIVFVVGSILFLWWLTALIGIAEGVIYLTKSDEEFQQIYVEERKQMF